MKQKNFFYAQYDAIDWQQQEKTHLNVEIYKYIIQQIVATYRGSYIAVFDMGCGIGFFLRMLLTYKAKFLDISLYGCEPSVKNFNYFIKRIKPLLHDNEDIRVCNKDFLSLRTQKKFDIITSTYVFPHVISGDVPSVVGKVSNMLVDGGLFFMAVAHQSYMEEKIHGDRSGIIEKNIISWNKKSYKEILSYAYIPHMGTVIDYNRDEEFYVDVCEQYGMSLIKKYTIRDSGTWCTLFCFEKMNLR